MAIFALGQYFDLTLNDAKAGIVAGWTWVGQREIRWLLLATASLGTAYWEFRNRGVPLTVVSTDVQLLIHTASGDDATVSRLQRIRANHENVTGYWRKIGATGSIPADGIECTISHSDSWKEFEPTTDGMILMHRFRSPIPKWRTVERYESIKFKDAFLKEEELLSHQIPFHYRHGSLTVTVNFHPDRQCPIGDCKALRITNAGVTDLHLDHVPPGPGGTPAGIRFRVRRAREGERYKIVWKFPASCSPSPTSKNATSNDGSTAASAG